MLPKAAHQAISLLAQLETCGLRKVVLAPGSRSAPLALGLASFPGLQVWTNPDERAAAFMALGLARAGGEPVLLLCSSGSAGLNMSPAVAEAYHQNLPLLVATADRPKRLLNTAEGQTMLQSYFFEGFLKDRFEPEEHIEDWRSVGQEAWQIARGPIPGPVHLNLRFDEPLYFEGKDIPETLKPIGEPHYAFQEKVLPNFPPKLLVLAGQLPKSLAQAIRPMLEQGISQGLNFWGDISSHLWDLSPFGAYPEWLWNQKNPSQMPEAILVIGGTLLPRRWDAFMQSNPKVRWFQALHFGPSSPRFHPNTQCLDLALPELMNQLSLKDWKTIDMPKGMPPLPEGWHDLSAAALFLQSLKEGDALHLGNSMSIRYASFLRHLLPKSVEVWCNRGLSGIDGIQSTACGHAAARPDQRQFVLTGDLAMNYDNNGWLSSPKPPPMTQMVLNNNGGQIFRLLPGSSKAAQREQLFATPSQGDFKWLAQRFGWEYLSSDGMPGVSTSIPKEQSLLWEAKTQPQCSKEAWEAWHKSILEQKA